MEGEEVYHVEWILKLLGDRFPSLFDSMVSLVYLDCLFILYTVHLYRSLFPTHARCSARCPHPFFVPVVAPHLSWTFTSVLLDYSVSHVPP